jgi:hypothetical protein
MPLQRWRAYTRCVSQAGLGLIGRCLLSLGATTTDRCGRQIGGNKLDNYMSTALGFHVVRETYYFVTCS